MITNPKSTLHTISVRTRIYIWKWLLRLQTAFTPGAIIRSEVLNALLTAKKASHQNSWSSLKCYISRLWSCCNSHVIIVWKGYGNSKLVCSKTTRSGPGDGIIDNSAKLLSWAGGGPTGQQSCTHGLISQIAIPIRSQRRTSLQIANWKRVTMVCSKLATQAENVLCTSMIITDGDKYTT